LGGVLEKGGLLDFLAVFLPPFFNCWPIGEGMNPSKNPENRFQQGFQGFFYQINLIFSAILSNITYPLTSTNGSFQ
jgi:hypothetical protein